MTGLHILILLVYVAGGLLTTAAFVAHSQKEYPYFANKDYRQDLALGVLLGFFLSVIGWFLVFFITGFYEHGFQLRRPK